MESGWLGWQGRARHAEITSHPDQNGGFATGPGRQGREIGFVGLCVSASAVTLDSICC